jgi:hypothetical protein
MADHLIDYVQQRGPTHISVMSAELAREFDLPQELDDRQFAQVRAKAKDLAQLREPPLAFMPQKEKGTQRFVGFWTVRPKVEDAVAHAELQIKQVATRAYRDGRNYLIVSSEAGNPPELEDRRRIVHLFALAGQTYLDDIRGVVRSDEFVDHRTAEMVRLVADLSR